MRKTFLIIVGGNDEEEMVTLELIPKKGREWPKSLKFRPALHNFSKIVKNEN